MFTFSILNMANAIDRIVQRRKENMIPLFISAMIRKILQDGTLKSFKICTKYFKTQFAVKVSKERAQSFSFVFVCPFWEEGRPNPIRLVYILKSSRPNSIWLFFLVKCTNQISFVRLLLNEDKQHEKKFVHLTPLIRTLCENSTYSYTATWMSIALFILLYLFRLLRDCSWASILSWCCLRFLFSLSDLNNKSKWSQMAHRYSEHERKYDVVDDVTQMYTLLMLNRTNHIRYHPKYLFVSNGTVITTGTHFSGSCFPA